MLTNPQRLLVLFAALQAFASLSVDISLPALPAIAQDLAASEGATQGTISIFSLGMCLGMLVFGPLSDKYGRRRLMLSGIVLYIIVTIGCVFAQSVDSLIVLRFLQAVGGAAAAVLSRAIVRDVFAPPEVPRVLSLMQLVSMLAVMIAPLLGSYILSLGSWRWIFGFLAMFSVVTGMLAYWKIPETHHQENRADSLRATFLSYWHIYTDPKGLGYVLMMALCFSGMFAYITVSPFVFIEFYGLSTYQFSLIFGANSFGIMLLSLLNARWVRAYGSQYMLRLGSAICLVSGLLLLTSAGLDNHFWLLMLGLFGVVSCVGLIGANATASLMQLYPRSAGAAAGLAVASQFGIGALIAMVASAIYDGTPMAMILVVALCGIAVPVFYQLTRQQAQVAN